MPIDLTSQLQEATLKILYSHCGDIPSPHMLLEGQHAWQHWLTKLSQCLDDTGEKLPSICPETTPDD